MAGYLGASPVPQTIQKKQSFTATASQTTFTTTGYTDGNFINVFLNGVRLVNGTDYTATNGSDIVLTTGASASDVLDFETFNEFTLVDQTLETPTFRTSATLKNDTHEDTDGGRESTLIFKGEQSGGEISTLAEIEASHDGTADDEKGDLIFRTNDGSDGSSPTEAMRITSQQRLGLGTTAPSEQLHISNADDAVVLVESTGSDATDDANIQLKTTNGTFTIQNDRSIGTSGALTIAGNTSNNIVVDHDSGNVGISKVPNSWRTTDVALQLGDSTSEYANFVSGGTGVTFGAGWYRDGVSNNFKYTHSATTAGRYDYNYTASNVFSWHQAAAGTAGNNITFTEIMRADEDGLKFNGDTAAANALDDYEEGEHEVTLVPSGSGTISVSGSNNDVSYTKMGNRVHVTGQILSTGSSSPVGYIKFSLPFPIKSSGTANTLRRVGGHVVIRYTSLNVNQYELLGIEGESHIRIYRADSTDLLSTSANQFSSIPGTGISILVNFTYPTDS